MTSHHKKHKLSQGLQTFVRARCLFLGRINGPWTMSKPGNEATTCRSQRTLRSGGPFIFFCSQVIRTLSPMRVHPCGRLCELLKKFNHVAFAKWCFSGGASEALRAELMSESNISAKATSHVVKSGCTGCRFQPLISSCLTWSRLHEPLQ